MRTWSTALCLMLIACGCGHRAHPPQSVRGEEVRVQRPDGSLTVHAPRPVRPVEISDAEFRSAMLMAARHWPILLDTSLAAMGGRLLLASAEPELTAQRSFLEGYAQHCERRRSPGDCYTLLEDGPVLGAKDVRSIALRIALAQALQLAFETLSNIDAEAIKAALVTVIGSYVAMWLLPEPISKAAALAFTAAMIAYVGTDVFRAIRDGFAELKGNLEAARTFEDVSIAGERLGQRLGPSMAKVMVLVASFAAGGALAKLPLPKLPGGPGAVANATTQGLVLSSLRSITVVPGSITFAAGATSAGGLLMMSGAPERGALAGPLPGDPRYEGPKPRYHVNPAHNPNSPHFNPRKTPVPDDAEEVFRRAVPSDPIQPRHWFGLSSEGKIYRFSDANDGTAHFSGVERLGDGVRNITDYALQRLGLRRK